ARPELPAAAKLACDRARAAGCERVDEATRARLHVRYARLLADGQAANHPRAGCAVDAGPGAHRPAGRAAMRGCWPTGRRPPPPAPVAPWTPPTALTGRQAPGPPGHPLRAGAA